MSLMSTLELTSKAKRANTNLKWPAQQISKAKNDQTDIPSKMIYESKELADKAVEESVFGLCAILNNPNPK